MFRAAFIVCVQGACFLSFAVATTVTCSMRRMGCPVPEDFADGNYVILGNESSAGACQVRGAGSDLYFEFGVDECNATVVSDDSGSGEIYTATLVPDVPLGGLVFVDWPDIVCSCAVDLRGTVVSQVVEVVTEDHYVRGSVVLEVESPEEACADEDLATAIKLATVELASIDRRNISVSCSGVTQEEARRLASGVEFKYRIDIVPSGQLRVSELVSNLVETLTNVSYVAFSGFIEKHLPESHSYEIAVISITAIAGTVVEPTWTESISGRSQFRPAMTMYSDDTFAEPLQDVGGGVSVSSERFFLGISSASTEEVISVAGCTAAPTAAADDPFAQVIWEAYCPAGPFDARYHEYAPTNEVHLSMRAFMFVGFDDVVLTCSIVRCPSEPCGVCDPQTGRRLQSGDADAVVTRGLRLQVGPESKALVLPGVVAQSSLAVLFSSSAEQRTSSSPALESSATLLNCPVPGEERFVDALKLALEAWLGMESVEVTILEVLTTGVRGASRLRRRRLQGGAGIAASADGVVVRFEMAPTSRGDADYALARIQAVLAIKTSEDLARAVRTALETAFGVQAENLLAEKGPVERRGGDPATTAAAEQETSSGSGSVGKVDAIFLAVAAGAGLLCGALTCFAGAWCAGRMANRSKADPAEAAAAAADEVAPSGGTADAEQAQAEDTAEASRREAQ